MKKIFLLVLGCIVVSGAFAQFSFRLIQDINAYLFSYVAPTGLYAQQTITGQDGDPAHNNGVSSGILDRVLLFPVRNNNTGYYTPSSYNFFTMGMIPDTSLLVNGALTDLNTTRLYMNYTGRNRFQAYLSLDGSELTARMFNRALPSVNNLFDLFRIDEYWFRVNHDMFTLWFGDRDFPIKTAFFPDLTEWSIRMRVERFGVNVPGGNLVFRDRGNSIFRDVVNPANVTALSSSGYFIGSIKLLDHFFDIPVTVDVGFDIGDLQRQINQGAINAGQTRFGGGVRVSGEGIADQLNFDLTYKVRGGDDNRDDSWDEDLNSTGNNQPDGRGAKSHVLGLAFGFPTLVPNLSFSFAYTALFATFEDTAPVPTSNDPLVTKTGPLYSGIDMNLRFTGIRGLRLTLQNNVSFARADEPVFNDDGQEIGQMVSVLGDTNLARYRSQSWFALYNALIARYAISEHMRADLELVHRMGIITENNSFDGRGSLLTDWGTSRKTRNLLGASVYSTMELFSGILLQAGVSLFYDTTSTTYSKYLDGGPTNAVTTSWSGGGLGIGLPIRVMITW